MLLAGADLAWHPDTNNTALAFGVLERGRLEVVEADDCLTSLDAIKSRLSDPALRGVAIDAPLIVRNISGHRDCERLVSRTYGARKASCHAFNLTLYPDPAGVRLSEFLKSRGFEHAGGQANSFQIETYPHAAMIEMFGLAERLAYKKGTVARKRCGQVALAGYVRKLRHSPVLPMGLPRYLDARLGASAIQTLTGAGLKRNEDLLDALICLYVAALYASGIRERIFGDLQGGYVFVPDRPCI